jgi:hypothetical protein
LFPILCVSKIVVVVVVVVVGVVPEVGGSREVISGPEADLRNSVAVVPHRATAAVHLQKKKKLCKKR